MRKTAGLMAVAECLRLMPPADPTSPARVYGSPAKSTGKKECLVVQKVPSIQRLMDQKEQEELDQQQQTALDKEQEMDDDGAATVHTYKKSQYWTKEVEEKLGLGGADPYGLLELEERRWRASADEIRKAYRKLVLTKHPDKKAAMDAATPKKPEKKRSEDDDDDEGEEKEGGEEEEDAEFKLLSIAWELLGNTETRRQYDSIDNFNDFLPTTFRPNKDEPDRFFRVFGPAFARQAKFSNQTPVPQLGDADTPMAQVQKFYNFWFGFSSWRDFGLLCEHQLKEAEDREERRWMQRHNKNYTARIKKEEISRISAFVQLAYDHDPRVKAEKEEKLAAKQRVKDDKERAMREAKEAAEAARREKEHAESEAKREAAAAQQASANAKADEKKEKERLRSALKKARKELKALGDEGGAWTERAADLEVVSAVLPAEDLVALFATLSVGVNGDTLAVLAAAKAKAMA